jgi:hypothetical protein
VIEMANDRQLTVLEHLKDGPKRGPDLFKQLISSEGIDSLEKERISEHFPILMENLEKRRWIQRAQSYGNQVWYVLTQEGYYEILSCNDPGKLRRMQQGKLRRALLAIAELNEREINWSDTSNYTLGLRERLEDSERRANEMSKILPEKDVQEVKGQVLAALMVENRRPNRGTERRRGIIEGMIGELPLGIVEKAAKRAERKLLYYHKQQGVELDSNGSPIIYGKCFFCGADIVVKEAFVEAKLLSRYGGKKGEMVCCGCFTHMQWMEKHFGGESVEKCFES